MKTLKGIVILLVAAALLLGLPLALKSSGAFCRAAYLNPPASAASSETGETAAEDAGGQPGDDGAPLKSAVIEDTGIPLLEAVIDDTGVPLLEAVFDGGVPLDVSSGG
jgi:hypothetical protein